MTETSAHRRWLEHLTTMLHTISDKQEAQYSILEEIERGLDYVSPKYKARLAKLGDALERCVEIVSETRESLFECHTRNGDPATLDELARLDIIRFDDALAQAAEALEED